MREMLTVIALVIASWATFVIVPAYATYSTLAGRI